MFCVFPGLFLGVDERAVDLDLEDTSPGRYQFEALYRMLEFL
jgi:hypothetical protein